MSRSWRTYWTENSIDWSVCLLTLILRHFVFLQSHTNSRTYTMILFVDYNQPHLVFVTKPCLSVVIIWLLFLPLSPIRSRDSHCSCVVEIMMIIHVSNSVTTCHRVWDHLDEQTGWDSVIDRQSVSILDQRKGQPNNIPFRSSFDVFHRFRYQ
jgi:hypothetical protein